MQLHTNLRFFREYRCTQSRHVDRANPIHVKWADRYNTLECALSLMVACLINTSVIIGTSGSSTISVVLLTGLLSGNPLFPFPPPSPISEKSRLLVFLVGVLPSLYSIFERNVCKLRVLSLTVSAAVFFPNEHNHFRVVPHLDEIGFLDASSLLDDTLGKYVQHVLS